MLRRVVRRGHGPAPCCHATSGHGSCQRGGHAIRAASSRSEQEYGEASEDSSYASVRTGFTLANPLTGAARDPGRAICI